MSSNFIYTGNFVADLQNFPMPEIPEDTFANSGGFWLGKNLDSEHKQNLSLAALNRVHSKQTKSKISKSMQGVANTKDLKRSDANKLKLAEARRNAPRKPCSYCGKLYQAAGMVMHIKSHT
jgi:hypothetical protein